jgi:hexokinase
MADVPKDLLAEISKLEEMFTVPTERLKIITKQFIGELEKGK